MSEDLLKCHIDKAISKSQWQLILINEMDKLLLGIATEPAFQA